MVNITTANHNTSTIKRKKAFQKLVEYLHNATGKIKDTIDIITDGTNTFLKNSLILTPHNFRE